MGVDHHHDVGWPHADLRQTILEHRQPVRAFVLEAVNVLELVVFLVAGAGVDQDQPRWMFDQKTAHSHLNAIALVSWNPFLPQRFWHYAEHRTAIELLAAGLNRVDSQRSDLAPLHQWRWCGHAVVSRLTEVGMAGGRRFRFLRPRAPSSD